MTRCPGLLREPSGRPPRSAHRAQRERNHRRRIGHAQQVTITKNGTPAAVLIGIDEWESLQETLFWLSQPGVLDSIGEAKADVAAGRVQTQEQIRAEFNVPTRYP